MGNPFGTLSRLGSVAAVWLGTVIAVLWMETVIHVAAETFSAMKPWANANESSAGQSFLAAVVGVGGAFVGRGVIVAVGNTEAPILVRRLPEPAFWEKLPRSTFQQQPLMQRI